MWHSEGCVPTATRPRRIAPCHRPAALELVVVALVLALSARTAAARPWPCLPPLFDGGQRLYALPSPSVFWLQLLLRQHELCWRTPSTPHEQRVVLLGDSAAYGHPLPVEDTFGALLNDHFAQHDLPARLFNLAFINPYQLRDAVTLHAALAYDPDVIVYPVTLSGFIHQAPVVFPTLTEFFASNPYDLIALATDASSDLAEPAAAWNAKMPSTGAAYLRQSLRQAGAFVRAAARSQAAAIVALLHSSRPQHRPRPPERQTRYDCADTEWHNDNQFRDFSEWNILAYLDQLRRTSGIEVLVVNWPVAHEPVETCYNVRYTDAALSKFVEWVRDETAARNMPYLDLHDLLPADLFRDSMHLTPEGHRRIAGEVARVLDPIVRARAATPARPSRHATTG